MENPTVPGIIVRKYGGSSLADVPRILTVARDIVRARRAGHQVVVVVSAMGSTTDELSALAAQANASPPRRELDMLLSVGERITMSLLSMALAAEGCPAISFTGSQCGIITDTSHTDARILEVRGDRVRDALAADQVVIVAGFQGVSLEKEITTLGRGGSDTTAVALAAALGAERCEILKDVDAVMSADPSLVPDAHRHERLSWEEMEQIAAAGSGVVHARAVEYARQHGVTLEVRSSFHDRPGTRIAGTGAAIQPGACDRRSRYRPLAMHVDRDLTRLRLSVGEPEAGRRAREAVLCHLDPAVTVAEWIDAGPAFRWEIVAPSDAMSRLRGETSLDGHAEFEDGLTCVSLAGGRPDSWLEVQRHVESVLDGAGCRRWRLRADGPTLRLLLADPPTTRLLEHLHRELIPR